MTQTTETTELIAAIASEVGFKAELTNAEWGREFAELLFATEDEEAIKYVIADGAETYRSRYLTRTRSAARQATQKLTLEEIETDDTEHYVSLQLAFEIVVPGRPPVAARYATHEFLREAYYHDSRRLKGAIANNRWLYRAMKATEPYPDRMLGELVDAGIIDPAEFTEEAVG
jgi:hypothetical protein